MCMPPSSKFLTESNDEKFVKNDQYLAKIWTGHGSSVTKNDPFPSLQRYNGQRVRPIARPSATVE